MNSSPPESSVPDIVRRDTAARDPSAGWMARSLLTLAYAAAAVAGAVGGLTFGLQAGGGWPLAVIAAVCGTLFCTIMVDAVADRMAASRRP